MISKPKIVLDTNVLISIFIAKIASSPRKIFELFRQEKLIIFTSKELLNELHRALNYPKIKKVYRLSNQAIRQYLEFLQRRTKRATIRVIPQVIKSDPDDNQILACALTAKADFIVSGDKHLLKLEKYKGIKIVTPPEFVRTFQ